MAPQHPCNTPGCPALVPRGQSRCAAHRRAAEQQDRRLRGTSSQRGYGTAWQQLREFHIRAFPLCGGKRDDAYPPPNGTDASQCKREGIVAAAEDVHHIIPHRGPGDPLLLDGRNLESLCKSCHSAHTAAERGRK